MWYARWLSRLQKQGLETLVPLLIVLSVVMMLLCVSLLKQVYKMLQ